MPKHTLGHTLESDRNRVRNRPGSKVSAQDAIYKTDMVPGYTGFVPRSRSITGASSAVTSKMAMATHDREQGERQRENDRKAADRAAQRKLRPQPDYIVKPKSSYVSQTMQVPVTTTAYSPELGVMNGCTKHVPGKPWVSVSRNAGTWTRVSAANVRAMGSRDNHSNAIPTQPTFKPKPRGYGWDVDRSSVYVGTPGYGLSAWK